VDVYGTVKVMGREILERGDTALFVVSSSKRTFRHLVKVEGNYIALGDDLILPTEDVLGVGWGGRMQVGKSVITVLPPTPEDLIWGIERGAQIIGVKDACRIVSILGVRDGSRILEAGTGSGHMSAYIAFFLLPQGRLYSYDVSKENIERARRNLERLGLLSWVDLKRGDVAEATERDLDGAVLDLPDPERVLHYVKETLRPGAPLVCYLPTFNQIERAAAAMRKEGFKEIRAMEIMERELSLKEGAIRPEISGIKHTAFLLWGRRCSGE